MKIIKGLGSESDEPVIQGKKMRESMVEQSEVPVEQEERDDEWTTESSTDSINLSSTG